MVICIGDTTMGVQIQPNSAFAATIDWRTKILLGSGRIKTDPKLTFRTRNIGINIKEAKAAAAKAAEGPCVG